MNNNSLLIIEDNEQNYYMMKFLLEKNGFKVQIAQDGEMGIKMAQDQAFAAILLDIQLPGMDGYQVAEALTKNPAVVKTPIIAVTSYAMAGDREKAIEAGASGYIEKPVDPDTFVEQIRDFIRDHRKTRE